MHNIVLDLRLSAEQVMFVTFSNFLCCGPAVCNLRWFDASPFIGLQFGRSVPKYVSLSALMVIAAKVVSKCIAGPWEW